MTGLSKKLKIGLQPLAGGGERNPYADRMADNLRHLGDVLPFPSTREFTFNPFGAFRRRYDYLILNWIETAAYGPQGTPSFWRALRLHAYLLVAKAVAGRVIWVRHDNYPHGVISSGAKAYATKLLARIEDRVDVVITHSPVEAGGKRKYVPHPLYSTNADAPNPLAVKGYFFLFGHIAPYKKLDEVIRLVPAHINLVIAGPANNRAHLEKLQSLMRDKPNVHLLPGFMDSRVAARVALDSHGIIVANADADMVVSGSYLYALSLGVPLFAVTTPFVNWLGNTSGLGGVHAYDSLESLVGALSVAAEADIRPTPAMVDELFGDAAVLQHLQIAMGLPGVPR